MVGLFCSCVKITDPGTMPANEVCFYASVLVSSPPREGIVTLMCNNQPQRFVICQFVLVHWFSSFGASYFAAFQLKSCTATTVRVGDVVHGDCRHSLRYCQ